ncbi:MAG: hydroxyethylthiazole kinase, partial [Geminicoccaceae bacterium]|nr:hydroxyethylthiazole kinase [Geminicoccaceae bacterium]
MTPEDLCTRAAASLRQVREERPKVHVLTNFVAMNVSANVLLAVGAIPS